MAYNVISCLELVLRQVGKLVDGVKPGLLSPAVRLVLLLDQRLVGLQGSLPPGLLLGIGHLRQVEVLHELVLVHVVLGVDVVDVDLDSVGKLHGDNKVGKPKESNGKDLHVGVDKAK